MQFEGKLLRAGAILQTPPATTTIPFEALFGTNSVMVEKEVAHQILTGEQGWSGKVLIRVRPEASLRTITEALQQAVDSSPNVQKLEPEVTTRQGKSRGTDIALSPLRYAYFDHEVAGNFIAAPGERANPVVVAGLGAIAKRRARRRMNCRPTAPRLIGLLVVREIGSLIAIAAVIGLPLAAVAIQRYLALYVERAPIGAWTLLAALASTVVVALVAVARHAWMAMRTMPSTALRV